MLRALTSEPLFPTSYWYSKQAHSAITLLDLPELCPKPDGRSYRRTIRILYIIGSSAHWWSRSDMLYELLGGSYPGTGAGKLALEVLPRLFCRMLNTVPDKDEVGFLYGHEQSMYLLRIAHMRCAGCCQEEKKYCYELSNSHYSTLFHQEIDQAPKAAYLKWTIQKQPFLCDMYLLTTPTHPWSNFPKDHRRSDYFLYIKYTAVQIPFLFKVISWKPDSLK